MQLTINVKQLGKKRPVVAEHVLTIDDLPPNPTLDDLITHVVRQQVQAYNAKRQQRGGNQLKESQQEENQLLNTLIIREKSDSGKIGFGDIYNDKPADENTAIETALLAFTDGLYCVFIDEEQIEQLDSPITIDETHVVSFVRLTFLSGSLW